MTLPHSTQLTLPAFCSATETQYEIMRLCVQVPGRLFESGIAASDSWKLMMRSQVTVGSRFRLVWRDYGRIVAEALSTRAGLSCRIDTTSNVVVCTTEGSELRVLSFEFLVLSWKILRGEF